MILSVRHISKAYRKEKVLQDISFVIKEPQIVALIGPNGAGKSTLLNIITNLLAADRGEVTILNKSNKDPEIFREIAFMQDNSVLYHYLTGYDHLQFIGSVQGIKKKQIYETAERIGSIGYLHKRVEHYSLGMKQHLLLTMALLNQPKLLILDEPLNGLDPTSALKVRKILSDLSQEGTTIFLSSHQLAEIDHLTNKILFLKKGQLIKEELAIHENIYYQVTVKEIEQAKQAFQQAGFSWKSQENSLLLFTSNFQTIAAILQQHSFTILDVEKRKLGSEERYQQIFVKGNPRS